MSKIIFLRQVNLDHIYENFDKLININWSKIKSTWTPVVSGKSNVYIRQNPEKQNKLYLTYPVHTNIYGEDALENKQCFVCLTKFVHASCKIPISRKKDFLRQEYLYTYFWTPICCFECAYYYAFKHQQEEMFKFSVQYLLEIFHIMYPQDTLRKGKNPALLEHNGGPLSFDKYFGDRHIWHVTGINEKNVVYE